MRFLRLIGWLLILVALGFLVHEGYVWLDGGTWTIASANDLWSSVHRESFDAVETAVRDLSPVAGNAFRTVMDFPCWAVIGGLGLLLVAIGSARHRRKRNGSRKRYFKN